MTDYTGQLSAYSAPGCIMQKSNNLSEALMEMLHTSRTEIYASRNCRLKSKKHLLNRMLIAYFMKRYSAATLDGIGEVIFKNHATVLHINRAVQNRIDTEREFREYIEALDNRIPECYKTKNKYFN